MNGKFKNKWIVIFGSFILIALIATGVIVVKKYFVASNTKNVVETTPNESQDLPKVEEDYGEDVTDTRFLSLLWDEYIYDTIATIGNSSFEKPEDIKRHYAIQYGIIKVIKAADYKSLDGGYAKIEKEVLSKYIEKYLKLKLDDINTEKEYASIGFYDEVKGGFKVNDLLAAWSHGGYNEMTPWSIKLDFVKKNKKDGTITVQLKHFVDENNIIADELYIYTLKEYSDGSLYFTQFKHADTGLKLVEIYGDHDLLNPKDFIPDIVMGLSSLDLSAADLDGKLIVEGRKFQDSFQNSKITISLYNPKTKKIENSIEDLVNDKESPYMGVRVTDDKVIFKTEKYFFYTNRKLKYKGEPEKMQIPRVILDNIKSEEDKTYYYYDVSSDLENIIYTNKDGLFLYNYKSQKSTLLSKHLEGDPEMMPIYSIYNPGFLEDDKTITAYVACYEGVYGLLLQNIEYPEKPVILKNTHPIDFSWKNRIAKAPLMKIFSAGTQGRTTYKIEMRDFKKEAIPGSKPVLTQSEVDFQDEENQQVIGEASSNVYFNEDYLVYIADQLPYEGEVNRIFNVVRVNLKTMKAETVLKIKAGYPQIHGLTSDGRIMLSYSFYRKNGLLLTK